MSPSLLRSVWIAPASERVSLSTGPTERECNFMGMRTRAFKGTKVQTMYTHLYVDTKCTFNILGIKTTTLLYALLNGP